MTVCYLGLGSNLGSPKRQLRQGVAALQKLPNLSITAQSRLYLSAPLGERAQPAYYNMVIAIHTRLSAQKLLRACQAIENQQQRIRQKHWGARTLDIDLLLYGNQTIKQRNLTIPHPEMLFRDFVLLPLLEIVPEIRLPNRNRIQSYLEACETHIILKTF